MIAHLTMFPGRRHADNVAAVAAARSEVAGIGDRLEKAINLAESRGHAITAAEKKAWRNGTGWQHGSGGGADDCKHLARLLGLALGALKSAEGYKTSPRSLHIAVTGSYDHRESLDKRGYSYSRDAHWLDMVGRHTLAGWWVEIDLDACTEERIVNEITWLRDLGCAFAERGWLDSLAECAARAVHSVNPDQIPY